jgi:hypothetical protein
MFRFALIRPADLTRLTSRHVDQVLDRANDNEPLSLNIVLRSGDTFTAHA